MTLLRRTDFTLAVARLMDLITKNSSGTHSRLVARFSGLIADQLGWSSQDTGFLLEAALLHDVGISDRREHELLVSVFDNHVKQEHANKGGDLLKQSALFEPLSPVVAAHHVAYDEFYKHNHLSDKEKLMANIIYIADRAAIVYSQLRDRQAYSSQSYGNQAILKAQISEAIRGLEFRYFSPELTQALEQALPAVNLLEFSNPVLLDNYFSSHWIHYTVPAYENDSDALLNFGYFVAQMVDSRHGANSGHSLAVANITKQLAVAAGLDSDSIFDITMAALLHDVGLIMTEDHEQTDIGFPVKAEPEEIQLINVFIKAVLGDLAGKNDFVGWTADALSVFAYPIHIHLFDKEVQILIHAHQFQFETGILKRSPIRALTSMEDFVNRGLLTKQGMDLVMTNLDACVDITREFLEQQTSE